MKNIILFLLAIGLFCNTSFAQTNVQLNIHHKLGTADFALNTATTNNLDNDFNVNRLEYYISEISITHDGGTITTIDDLYLLVNAAESTEVDLGNLPITEIEELTFFIGVDEAHNHLDPATYPADHPLAPQNPSMHWGWLSGYRFIAMEGLAGDNLNQVYELHGLGDENYSEVAIPLMLVAENDELVINIDADYTQGLKDIDVSGGLIVHSLEDEAQDMIINFKKHVFTPSSLTSSIADLSGISEVALYPNPSSNGTSSLLIESNEANNYGVVLSNVLGQTIQSFKTVPTNTALDLNLNQAGLYLVNIMKEGEVVATKKLIIQ